MFEKFDGSDRQIRPAQTEALNWLKTNWDQSKVFGISAGTGVGKSAILRAIQLEFKDTAGLVPTNVLMDQYIETYPTLNYFKGVEHYYCTGKDDLNCAEKQELNYEHEENCPYLDSRRRANAGEPTIFNPISFYYYQKNAKTSPKVLVIDEGHRLVVMLMLLVGGKFKKSATRYPNIKNEIELLAWLRDYQSQLENALELEKKRSKIYVRTDRQRIRVQYLIRSLSSNPQDFVFFTKNEMTRGRQEEYLYIQPVTTPKWLLNTILDAEKIIVLSATLLESDLWDLGLNTYLFKDVGTPIPLKNRPVAYIPNSKPMNFKTSPEDVAEWITQMLERYPNRNTIVHLSYSWVEKLKPFFPSALTHTPETKVQAIEQFKEKGGLWLAAGCSEGIDLKDDLCRLNLIPFLIYGNPYDPVIKKQLARPRGKLNYELNVLKTVIQQVGRSTRSVTDHSIAIIGDNRFPKLLISNSSFIPKSFSNSIIWRDHDKNIYQFD